MKRTQRLLISMLVVLVVVPLAFAENCSDFGLAGTLDITSTECDSSTDEAGNQCFSDRSLTNVEKCYTCITGQSCADYRSKAACEADACTVGIASPCEWEDTNSELGIGVCKESTGYNCLACEFAQLGAENFIGINSVFDQCTQEKAEALSTDEYECLFDNVTGRTCDSSSINLIQPRSGGSKTSPVKIQYSVLDTATECRYSLFQQSFSDMSGQFSAVSSFIREASISVSGQTDVFVKCRDSNQTIHSDTLTLVVDTTKPIIKTAVADPKVVIERVNGSFQTTLRVETDDPTFCKYDFATENFTKMRFSFGSDNLCKEYTYTKTHNKVIANLSENASVTYNVVCLSPTGDFSRVATADVIVDTTQAGTIVVIEPVQFSSDTTIQFNISTTKSATCKYDESRSFDNATDITTSPAREHISAPFTVTSGRYTYFIECLFTPEGPQVVSTQFVIDTSKPDLKRVSDANPVGTDPQVTFSLNKLHLFWNATENESEVETYYIELFDQGENATNSSGGGTKVKEIVDDDDIKSDDGVYHFEEFLTDLDLNDTHRYYFEVTVDNSVGLNSSTRRTDGILVDTSKIPASCKDGVQNNNETDVDCGGGLCGTCELNNTCLVDKDCDTSFCHPIDFTCQEPSCSDDVQNQDELGVDCGGSCPLGCLNGTACVFNFECSSGFCDPETKTCGELTNSTCSNGVLNADETDIDCGGACPTKCGSGMGCKFNADCDTGFCDPATLTCGAASCDDLVKNQDESDVDCGGTICGTPCGAGQQCNFNSDCMEGTRCSGAGVCSRAGGDDDDKDTDGDGLPDAWELRYGLDPNSADDPNSDSDGDGLTLIQEYQQNRNPGIADGPDDGGDGLAWYWWVIIVLLVLALLGVGGYYAYEYYEEQERKKKMKKMPPQPRRPLGTRPGMIAPPHMKPHGARPALKPTNLSKPPQTIIDRRKQLLNKQKKVVGLKKQLATEAAKKNTTPPAKKPESKQEKLENRLKDFEYDKAFAELATSTKKVGKAKERSKKLNESTKKKAKKSKNATKKK